MRMSGFLLGGLVGAAAAIYWRKGGKLAISSGGLEKSLHTAGKWARSAKDMWGRTGVAELSGSKEKHGNERISTDADSKSTLEHIIASDPELQQQVDELMRQNGRGSLQ